MSTLLQLINEVLRRTGQVEIATLTDAQTPTLQTRDFLNETYFEMLQRLKVSRLHKEGNISTVAGTAGYSLASDADIDGLLEGSLVDTATENLLRPADYRYPLTHGVDQTGRPEVYYRLGSQLLLYPIPDDVYTIAYQYLVKPVSLTADADQTELPEDWEKVLILGTQARLEKFLGEGGEDSFFLYRDGLAHLKARSPLTTHTRMRGFYRGSGGS